MPGGQYRYVLNFTQGDLLILVNADVYEGSCRFLSHDAGRGYWVGIKYYKEMERSGIWFIRWRMG